MKWTSPHHGVQHLKPVKQGFQVTAEHHERHEWSAAYVLQGFTQLAGERFEGPTHPADARAWAEHKARELGLVP